MSGKFKRSLVSLVLFISLFMALQAVLAADYGLSDTVSQGNVSSALSVSEVGNSPGQFISKRTGQIIGSILAFIGVIFFILVIWAGFTWMTSRGNEKQVQESKDLIVAAIIGLVIILAAYSITAFIGRQLTTTAP